MKHLWVLLFVVCGVASLLSPLPVQAQYDNTNTVVGQVDAYNTNNPVTTTSYLNAAPVPNAYNFASSNGGIVFDETRDRLYVVDRGNNRVLMYETDGSNNIPYGTAPDAILGQPNATTRTATTSQSGLSSPSAIELDETNGRLFVADTSNGRVMVFNVSGAVTTNMNAANYLGGGADFNTVTLASTAYATTNLNQFNAPQGLGYDPDTNFLYVADNAKKRVTIFDVAAITNGESARSEVLGDASGNFSLNGPRKIEIDTTNNRLFLADTAKHRVLVYDIAALVTQEDPVNVLGQPDFATVTSGTTQAKMFSPQDMAYKGSTNQLAVGMGNRTLIYDVTAISNGENATNVLGKSDFTSTSSFPISLSLTAQVDGVEWVGSNQLLALESNRLLSYDVTAITDAEPATNALGQVSPNGSIVTTTRTANGAFPNPYGFETPAAVEVDTTNNKMYVSDHFNFRVLVFNLDSSTKLPLDNEADFVLGQVDLYSNDNSTFTGSTLEPWGLAVDEVNQLLFVADQGGSRVLVFDVSTITNGEAAVNVLGQPDFVTSAPATTSQKMDSPYFVEYNSADEWLFVADGGNNRVLVFDLSNGITNGMAAKKVLGQPDFISSDCNLTQSGMCDARGQTAFDQNTRNLFVTDAYQNRILAYTLAADIDDITNGMNANYVVGQSDFVSEAFSPPATRLDLPYGLALTSSGMLLVNDCFNYRIVAYDVTNLANDPAILGVIGQTDTTTEVQAAVGTNTMGCDDQQGMDFDDTSQRLYLVDSEFHRVVAYDMAKITTTTLPDGSTSSSYSQSLSSSQLNGTGTFTVQSGSLPTGLSLSSPNITGTPTTNGIYDFTLRLTDDSGAIGDFFATQEYSVNIGGVSPSPTPTPTPSPTPAVSYSNTSNVLGQFEVYESTDPVDNTSYVDSIPSPNAFNFDSNLGQIIVDETRHRLFVSDVNNNRVLVYELNTNNDLPFGEPADYVLGQPNFTTASATTSQSGLSGPRGLALDEANGLLYVADSGNYRVMIFDVSGFITTNMNAVRYLGSGGSFNGAAGLTFGYETGNLNGFSSPAGLAYDPDTSRLYVSDSSKHRITVFSVSTITNGESALSTVIGDSSGNFLLSSPSGMDIDTTANRLFLADLSNNRVLIYDITTVVLQEDPINVLGQPDFATVTSGLSQSKLFGVHDVAYRPTGNLLAVGSSGGRVTIFDVAAITNGENAVNILGQIDYFSNDDTISLSFTDNVNGVEWVGTNQLLALDINRLLSFDVTSISDGEAATNVLGQVDPFNNISTTTRVADGSSETAYGMQLPTSVRADTVNNRLYVADANNARVLVYNLDNTTKLPLDNQADYVLGQDDFVSGDQSLTTTDDTFNPWDIEIDVANNRLFVTDQGAHRVLVFDVSTITNGEAAVNVIGQPNFTSNSNSTTDSSFNTPFFMAHDTTNNWLFVGDAYNYRILVFDLSSGISNGMAASKVIGQADFTTAACNLTQNGLCDVEGQLTFDTDTRRLYVVDPYGNRVLVYTIPASMGSFSNGMNASYVIGQADFTTDAYTPVESRFNNSYGIAVTDSDMLLVHDCFNYRILAYDVTTLANDPTPIGVIGQLDFNDVTELAVGPRSLSCYFAQGIDYDDTGNHLFVADSDFNRVVTYDFAEITTTSLPDGAVASSYSEILSASDLNGTGTFSVQSGTLPTGLSLSSPTISGTPTLAGIYPFVARLSDATGDYGFFFTSQNYSVTITASPTPTPSPTATPDPSATPTPSPTPTSTPTTTPSPTAEATPSPSPTPSPVSAGAPNLGSPSSGSPVTNPPSFSWTAPAEPEKVESYTLLVNGQVLFSNIPTNTSLETADYILVYTASNQGYLLQLKEPLPNGVYSWEVQAISTTGNVTGSGSNTFTIGPVAAAASPSPTPLAETDPASSSAAIAAADATPEPSPTSSRESVDLREQAIQIMGAATNLDQFAAQVLAQIKPAAPFVPTAFAVATTLATAGFVAVQVGSQIFNPKILLEVLRSLGLLAQKPAQGMIFDAATFTPIPFALITLTNADKSVSETVVTDMYGVYRGVKLPLGEYQLTAAHQEYSFPTVRRRPSYFSSKDFYQGESFMVSSEKYQQLFLIPMDDLLHRQRKRTFRASFSHFFGRVLHHQNKITAFFFALSLLMTAAAPNLLNIILTASYGILVVKNVLPLLAAPMVAGIVSGPQGRPLSGVVVRFADPSSNELKALAQTDAKGAYKAFIDKGTYQVAATKLGYLWQEAGMSLNQMTFNKPSKVNVKMQKAETINLF